ncbi:MFS transporter [Nocardia amamiensis]|uniref:MFS transporter n=1 Tax=Nocardia amamiensis TaxID=404578 RepID=A0ABS0D6M8_9NOCA|nr:MFS transporter [Nocardia amamiensis]MBF6302819.1 MFS transporter [Nocardia amamiensis]
MPLGAAPFVRDRMTVLCYNVLGAYTFWLYAFGPALSLLRAELGFSYTMISVYSALWAAGSILDGLAFPALAAWAERRVLLWSSALVTTVGAALFTLTLSHGIAVTLVATLVMGWAGTTVQTTTQSVLADRHGPRRDTAFVESDIGAAAAAVLAPLALGILQSTPATWRTGMALPAVGMMVLYLLYHREPFPAAAPHTVVREGRNRRPVLPLDLSPAVCAGGRRCRRRVLCGLLRHRIADCHNEPGDSVAAVAMTAFYAGILLGRVGGARLTRRPGRTVVLVGWSRAITLAGLLTLLLATTATVAVIGLFVTGVGIANQFPLVPALAWIRGVGFWFVRAPGGA